MKTEETEKREVKVSGIYKHFKGKYYKVLAVGKHTETLEEYVVYTRINDDDKTIYLRPKEMFMSEVDREKYPDVKQKYRFELCE